MSSPPDPQTAFSAFLAKLQALRIPGNATETKTYRQIKALDSFTVTSDWDAAGAQARRTAFTLDIVSSKLARLQAPAGLQAALLRYANMWTAEAQTYGDLGRTLLAHQTFLWSTYDSRWRADYAESGRFRVALVHYASSHGLRLPKWIRALGAG